ncbi:hypothetical protein HYQ46_001698 [Verticillium longisporum]|nr:hypothetical protein HYQ46_001698 [Verticillium longisporum]
MDGNTGSLAFLDSAESLDTGRIVETGETKETKALLRLLALAGIFIVRQRPGSNAEDTKALGGKLVSLGSDASLDLLSLVETGHHDFDGTLGVDIADLGGLIHNRHHLHRRVKGEFGNQSAVVTLNDLGATSV